MNDPTLQKVKVSSRPRRWALWISLAVAAALVALVATNLSLYKVRGSSMEDAYSSGDYVLVVKDSKIENNELIFFTAPVIWGEIAPQEKGKQMMRRVGARPGSILTFNGREFASNGKVFATIPKTYNCNQPTFERVLRNDEIFVVGDNLQESLDSLSIYCRGGEGWLITRDLVRTTGRPIFHL